MTSSPTFPPLPKRYWLNQSRMTERKKFYITTPIYYVNDKPHIGSAYTTIAADVIARLHRQAGDNVYFLTGTAEHGTKIAESAEKAGKDIQAFVDENAVKFSTTWENLDIQPDDFIRTTEDRHVEAVKKFFLKLKDSGKVYEGEYEGLYCVGCEAFKKESELTPEGLCPLHNKKPEKVSEQNWFFKLSDYQQILKEKIEDGEISIEPENRKNEVLSFINQGLEDIAISRRSAKFAIPLPWDQEQTIYVWLDELFNYCSAVGYGADDEKFNTYWPADAHLMGKDIIKFHCIIWPALLLAIGLEPPKKIVAHGFFTVNGQKMSKTLGNVIDPNEWAMKYGADVVRYFVLREVPFGQDGDVSEEKLKMRYKADLANSLGNLFSRLTNMIEKFSGGAIPDLVPSSKLKELEDVTLLTNGFKFSLALERIWEVLQWANQTIDKEKPWELVGQNDAKLHALLSDLAATLYEVAKVLSSFMPETCEKIRTALSAEKIIKAEPLFPQID